MSEEAKKNKSILQVQTLLPMKEKQKHRNTQKTCQASFTIEAAISLSIFIFACVVMMVPMLIFHRNRNISTVLEEQSRKVSQYEYARYYLEAAEKLELSPEILTGMETGLSVASILAKIDRQGMTHIDVLRDTEIDEAMVRYVVNYNAVLPFRLLQLKGVPQQVVASRRAWVGADGQRWNGAGSEDGTETDPIVYVGITSVRYHLDAMCSYLKHNVHMVSGSEIMGMRTQSGGRYSPCAACKPNTGMSAVYYTDNGRAYHGRIDCSSMKSYVQARRLSEVAYMGACSRCGT